MLSNLSQYSPQGLLPQFPGLQAAGWPQMSPGLFTQPGANSGNASFGHESGQAGFGQQYPFGAQANSFQQNPFAQNQFLQNPFAMNPYLQSQLLQGSLAHNPQQHIVAILGHLAQQLSIHGALTQQIAIALHQLTQQLAVQSLQSYPGGLGAGQAFAGSGQPYAAGAGQPLGFGGSYFGSPTSGAGQYFGQNPFASAQGGYGGFNPQAQAWGANRPQTIQ
jgi:hypothetical protein